MAERKPGPVQLNRRPVVFAPPYENGVKLLYMPEGNGPGPERLKPTPSAQEATKAPEFSLPQNLPRVDHDPYIETLQHDDPLASAIAKRAEGQFVQPVPDFKKSPERSFNSLWSNFKRVVGGEDDNTKNRQEPQNNNEGEEQTGAIPLPPQSGNLADQNGEDVSDPDEATATGSGGDGGDREPPPTAAAGEEPRNEGNGGEKPEPKFLRDPQTEEDRGMYEELKRNEEMANRIRERFRGYPPDEAREEILKLGTPVMRQFAADVLGVQIPEQFQVPNPSAEDAKNTEEVHKVLINQKLSNEDEFQAFVLSESPDFRDRVENEFGNLPNRNDMVDAINASNLSPLEKAAAANVLNLELIRTANPTEPESTGTQQVVAQEGITTAVAGGGGGGEIPPTDEGDQGEEREHPENENNSLEYLASPEYGLQLAREILKWEAMRVAGEYEKVDWDELDRLYQKQRAHVTAQRLISLRFTPEQSIEERKNQEGTYRGYNPENLKTEDGIALEYTPRQWAEAFENFALDNEQLEKFKKEASAYIKEAQEIGLLKGLNDVLNKTYFDDVLAGMRRGLTAEDIMQGDQIRSLGVEAKIRRAIRSLDGVLRSRLRSNPEMIRLAGVGDLYARLAIDKFYQLIDGKDPDAILDYDIENEFKLHEQEIKEESRENYWRMSQGGYYVEIYAQTDDEYTRAAETYLGRLEEITAAPDQVFRKAEQFIDILMFSEGANKVSPEFLRGLVDQIYARLGAFGADHANELYHGDQYKQYLDFINKDAKGPDRWLLLHSLFEGEAAAAIWMLDKDPRWEIIFATYGTHGQLSRAAHAQRGRTTGLFNQVEELFIEELIGIRIKDKANVANLAKNATDKQFVSLFDGLYLYDPKRDMHSYGDANKKVYRKYADKEEKEVPKDERRAWRLGRIQLELEEISHAIQNGTIKETEWGKAFREREGVGFNPLRHKNYELLIDEKDQKLYKQALERAKKVFEVAFEIYGATGEKSKRAGGVFKVKRNINGREVFDFVPIHYAEKFVQFAETVTKMKYADDSEVWRTGAIYDDEIAKRVKKRNKEKGLSEMTNFKAQYRTAKVAQARDKAIEEFAGPERVIEKDGSLRPLKPEENSEEVRKGKNIIRQGGKGFQAKLYEYDAKGSKIGPMKVKLPKEDLETGVVTPEEKEVDFHLATHHFYGNWTSHTYWSYQEEDRQLLLAPETFANARKIRAGEMIPEHDPWAVQLLILDPTLNRVAQFPGNFEDRERKLTMAAVEDSYQSHWRITRELHRAFFPTQGTPAKYIGFYYGLQDYGGYRKYTESMRARYAEDPERFMRRGRRLLPDLHNPIAALSEIWGQGTNGVTGVMRMFNAPIYRQAGGMALDKFAAQAEVAGRIAQSLEGGRDRNGDYDEGLLLKLTNNSDKLSSVLGNLPLPGKNWQNIKNQSDFCYAIMESLGRLKRYEQTLVVMETQIRNASGAQWLENVDVLENGELNPQLQNLVDSLSPLGNDSLTADELNRFIENSDRIAEIKEAELMSKFNESDIDEGSVSTNTGSGRHSAKIFHDTFGRLLVDASKRGGQNLYRSEILPYGHIFDKIIIQSPELGKPGIETKDTIWDFVFSKFVPT